MDTTYIGNIWKYKEEHIWPFKPGKTFPGELGAFGHVWRAGKSDPMPQVSFQKNICFGRPGRHRQATQNWLISSLELRFLNKGNSWLRHLGGEIGPCFTGNQDLPPWSATFPSHSWCDHHLVNTMNATRNVTWHNCTHSKYCSSLCLSSNIFKQCQLITSSEKILSCHWKRHPDPLSDDAVPLAVDPWLDTMIPLGFQIQLKLKRYKNPKLQNDNHEHKLFAEENRLTAVGQGTRAVGTPPEAILCCKSPGLRLGARRKESLGIQTGVSQAYRGPQTIHVYSHF